MAEVQWGLLNTPDYFGNALRARAMGRVDRVNEQRDNALATYGQDPAAGIQQLQGVDPEAAFRLQQIQGAQATARARQQAGTQLASGDSAGARSTALGAGDLDLADAISKMDEASRAEAAKRAETLASVGVGLKKLPYEQRKAALMQTAPQLAPLGFTADQLNAFDPTDQNIDAQVNTALGIKGAIEQAHPKPIEMDPTKRYYLPGDEPSGGGQPAPQPTPARGPAPNLSLDAVWQAVKQQESGGNGNAVNPETGATGSTQLMMPTAEAMARKLGVAWNPSLMRGDTPNALAYQDKLGRAYFEEGLQKSGGDVAGALAYYYGGPDPAQHGPKTQKYVADVLGRLGAQPYDVAANGATPPPPAPKLPGYHMIQDASPQWQPDGKGALVNTITGDRKKDPSFEDKTPTPDPNVVKMVLEGRYPVPTGRAAASPEWLAVVQAAAAQDPNFNAADYPARAAALKDRTSGTLSKNILSMNTAVGHMGKLWNAIDEMRTTGLPANNYAARMIARGTGTDQRFADFETEKKAVSDELTRVMRGTGGAEADIRYYLDQLDAAKNPETLKKTVSAMADLLESRLNAAGDQYRKAFGLQDLMTILSPTAQSTMQMIRNGGKSHSGSDVAASEAIAQARDAISRGADRNAVIQRLRQHGIDPAGL